MKEIYLKGEYKIIGDVYSNLGDNHPSFIIPIKDKEDVSLIFKIKDKTIEALQKVEITDDLYSMFQSIKSEKHKKEEKKTTDEYFDIRKDMRSSVKLLLTRMKYYFNWNKINEQSFGFMNEFWSENNKDWNKLVNTRGKVTLQIRMEQMFHLDDNLVVVLNEDLREFDEPFLALKHLQRAEKDNDPRHKWIDATIAAELAIKEFFIKSKPDLEVLLLEMPSPPLHKLYGSILEHYFGEKSPQVSKISKGAQKRNGLIHRPNEESVSDSEATNYVSDIREAIIHLHSLLYPKRKILKTFENSMGKFN